MPEKLSGSLRFTDLTLTVELLVEAMENKDGARDRVAMRHQIQKSVITDRVRRIEIFFGTDLFGGPQRKDLTEPGKFMAKYGPRLVSEIEEFAEMIQGAAVEN